MPCENKCQCEDKCQCIILHKTYVMIAQMNTDGEWEFNEEIVGKRYLLPIYLSLHFFFNCEVHTYVVVMKLVVLKCVPTYVVSI